MCHDALPFYLESPTFTMMEVGTFWFPYINLMDPSQAITHLHETEEEEEMD